MVVVVVVVVLVDVVVTIDVELATDAAVVDGNGAVVETSIVVGGLDDG